METQPTKHKQINNKPTILLKRNIRFNQTTCQIRTQDFCRPWSICHLPFLSVTILWTKLFTGKSTYLMFFLAWLVRIAIFITIGRFEQNFYFFKFAGGEDIEGEDIFKRILLRHCLKRSSSYTFQTLLALFILFTHQLCCCASSTEFSACSDYWALSCNNETNERAIQIFIENYNLFREQFFFKFSFKISLFLPMTRVPTLRYRFTFFPSNLVVFVLRRASRWSDLRFLYAFSLSILLFDSREERCWWCLRSRSRGILVTRPLQCVPEWPWQSKDWPILIWFDSSSLVLFDFWHRCCG